MGIQINPKLFCTQPDVFPAHSGGKCFVFQLLFDGFYFHAVQFIRAHVGNSGDKTRQFVQVKLDSMGGAVVGPPKDADAIGKALSTPPAAGQPPAARP